MAQRKPSRPSPTPTRRCPHRVWISCLFALVVMASASNANAQILEGFGWWESTQSSLDRTMRFMTGREQADLTNAKQFYQQGDTMFREAAASASQGSADGETKGRETDQFARAAKWFGKAYEADGETALGQDALFMQGESLFFANRLTQATDSYQKLQKDFPRNRHSDQVASRLFSIAQYWANTEKSSPSSWYSLNFFDSTRPRMDVDGHAVRVLDSIRYDDPTGRLADDATMAAAAEYIRQEDYEMADEFLTDLRDTFPDSEHYFLAHMLGIRCKLEVYAGPLYSGLMLEEADKLVRQTRERFPNKMREQETSDMIARAAAEVAYRRAEHLFRRAEFREKKKEYQAASEYYQRVLEQFGSTPFADQARERLQRTATLPAVPERQLSWLKKVFPDSRRSPPLVPKFKSQTGEQSETIYR